MQCFQKDPNLRVSARKLLKHPWIVNARRSDSVVPKKSTEYEEAVRSVQEWNEALRSPDSGTLRRTMRFDRNSPVPTRPDLPPLITPAKDSTSTSVSKSTADKFRSPDGTDDNWDDDFATAISPSALRMPQFKPQDNFGGMLSSEKLKAFASLDGTTMKDISDSFEDGDSSMKSFRNSGEADPLQTIRPYLRKPSNEEKSPRRSPIRHRATKSALPVMTSIPVLTKTPAPPTRQPHPTEFYSESSVEDYSDLIVDDEDVLEKKLNAFQVSNYVMSCLYVRCSPNLACG